MSLGINRRRGRKFTPPALMLTSLMDMFTIILIFLLFSFSESPETLSLDQQLELPRSSSEAEYSNTVSVLLSKKELRINDQTVARVDGASIEGLSGGDPKDSAFFRKLNALYGEREKSPKGAAGGAPENTHLLLLCDKSHSFKTIHQVIKAAGLAGYPNFQFAVLEE